MRDDADEPEPPDGGNAEQRLAPLLGLASALAIAGTVLAFRAPDDAPTDRTDLEPPPEVAEPTDEEVQRVDRAVELVYRPAEIDGGRLHMVQETTGRGGPSVRASVTARVSTRRNATGGRKLSVEREYSRVDLEVTEDGRPVGQEVVDQVEVLMDGAIERSKIDPNGQVGRHEWPDVSNPSVRRTLRLVQHANTLLFPRFRAEPVNPGESWTYEFPSGLISEERAETVQGGITVEATFVGIVRRQGRQLAVVRRDVSLDGRASIDVDASDRDQTARYSGSGEGVVLFDLQRGAVAYSRLEIDSRNGLTAKIRGTSPTPPESRQSAYELVYWDGRIGTGGDS